MIPKEPDSIFAEMVKLTAKLISEKKMKWVGMGRLKRYLTDTSTHNPPFGSTREAINWINVAVDFKIYSMKEVPDKWISSKTVKLVSLSESKTRSML